MAPRKRNRRDPADTEVSQSQGADASGRKTSLPTPTNSRSSEELGARSVESEPPAIWSSLARPVIETLPPVVQVPTPSTGGGIPAPPVNWARFPSPSSRPILPASLVDTYPMGDIQSGRDRSPSPDVPEHTIFRGLKQPPPRIRLPQIKTFLADEDYFRCADFESKLEQVEEYIKDLEQNIYDYDLQAVKEIKQMIDVHRDWIKKDREIPQLSIDFMEDREPWHLKLAALSKDPDALQGRVHELVDCWKSSIGVLNTGKYDRNGELPRGEPLCLYLEPDKRPKESDPFEYSKKMGQYRLAMEVLYSLARDKLIYDRRNDASFVPPPMQWNAPYFPLSKVDVVDGKIKQYDKLKEVFNNLINAHRIAPRSILRDVLLEMNAAINGKEAVDLDIENDTDPLTDSDLENLVILTQPSWVSNSEPVRHVHLEQQDSLVEFFDDLQILIRDWGFLGLTGDGGRTVDEVEEFVNRLRLNRGESTLFTADEVDNFLAHLIDAGHFRIHNQEIIFRHAPDTHAERRFVAVDPEDADPSPLLADMRIDAIGTIDQAVAVDDLAFFVKAARRHGREIRRLRDWEKADDSPRGEQWDAIELLRNVYMTNPLFYGVGRPQTLVELAEPLREATDTSGMTEERAAALLQRQVIQEQHENNGPREPHFAKLWAWAKPLPKARAGYKFFSLDRWPLELQNKERQVEIMATGPGELPEKPRMRNLEEQEAVWEENVDERTTIAAEEGRETYYPGECIFPFAETPFQQAYQSWQIEEQLKNVPEFEWTRKQKTRGKKALEVDVFALPELDEKVKSQVARVREPVLEPAVLTEDHVAETEFELENLIREATQAEAGRKTKAAERATRRRSKRRRV